MAGGPEGHVVYLGCSYSFEDDHGGVAWKGEVRNPTFKDLGIEELRNLGIEELGI